VSESERLDPDQIAVYLELLPRSDLVIWVRSPLDVCISRICARGLQVRLRGLAERDVARFMANAEQVVSIVSRHIRSAGWQVVEVKNSDDLATCVAELHRDVAQFLSPMTVAAR
jgi:hypothetical protein